MVIEQEGQSYENTIDKVWVEKNWTVKIVQDLPKWQDDQKNQGGSEIKGSGVFRSDAMEILKKGKLR